MTKVAWATDAYAWSPVRIRRHEAAVPFERGRYLGAKNPSHAAHPAADVGDREILACEKAAAIAQFAVEPCPFLRDGAALRLGKCRELDQPILEELRRVQRDVADRAENLELDPPVPHFDLRRAQRARAEQRRRRVQHLEVSADRDAFCDDRTIIEHQDGNLPERIELQECRRSMFRLGEIDMDLRQVDAFLGAEDADTV